MERPIKKSEHKEQKSASEKTSVRNVLWKNKDVFIINAVCIAIACVCAATGIFKTQDFSIYDVLLKLSPEPEADDSIVLLEIDDNTLGEYGQWPWTRDNFADILIWLKEFGAKDVIFDIEYLSDSDRNCDDYFARAIQYFGNTSLTVNIRNLGINQGRNADEYAMERFFRSDVKDSDGLIEKCNQYTLHEEYADAAREWKKDGKSSSEIEENIQSFRKIVPARYGFISRAKNLGFTNVVVDKDGKRRRVELLSEYEYEGKKYYAAQLGFTELLRLHDVQGIERKKHSLVLQGFRNDDGSRIDLVLPLDENGRFMINWLHSPYNAGHLNGGINHFAVKNFQSISKLENLMIGNLMETASITDRIPSEKISDGDREFLSYAKDIYFEYNQSINLLNEILSECNGFDRDGSSADSDIINKKTDEYLALRKTFIEDISAFVASLDYLDDSSMEEIQNLKTNTEDFLNFYNAEKNYLQNKMCFIGLTASASTDLGVTSFYRNYPNLGLHANLVNSILQQDFVRCISVWWGILFSAVLTFTLSCVGRFAIQSRSKSGKRKFAVAIGNLVSVFSILLIITLLMVLFRIYVPLFIPVMLSVNVFFIQLIVTMNGIEKDRRFIREKFGAYVAPLVVDDLIKNPSLAQLGGVNKDLTALFSDVKSFSAFSEFFADNPLALQYIMNKYLTALGDVITSSDCYGTLDKFIGDEIVSFFGAPVDDKDNAWHSVVAAIKMKQAEDRFNDNELFYSEEDSANSRSYLIKDKECRYYDEKGNVLVNTETGKILNQRLESRVGLNSGDMVVGNLGTSKKLNYSIMGNNVNLASRLEGVNKIYGTWIIASENTWKKCIASGHENDVVVRKLDKVRVVNIKQPVQIYNIVGFSDECSEVQKSSVEIFNRGIDFYLSKDFDNAIKCFRKAAEIYPEDAAVSENFIQRCSVNLLKGVPENWDGVYVMEGK